MSLQIWKPFMRQLVDVAPRTGTGQFGAPTYGAAVTYRARLVGRRRYVIDLNGQQVVSGQTAYMATGDNILPDAKVTLSTGDVGSTESWAVNPLILATGRYPDERGRMLYTALYLS